MVRRVPSRRSACPRIASTAFVAAMLAPARVWRVPRRKKALASMANVGPLRQIPIPKTNVPSVDATARAYAPCLEPMAALAAWMRNAVPSIVSTVFVATPFVSELASRVICQERSAHVRPFHSGSRISMLHRRATPFATAMVLASDPPAGRARRARNARTAFVIAAFARRLNPIPISWFGKPSTKSRLVGLDLIPS